MFDAPICDLLAPEEATPPTSAISALALAAAFLDHHGDGLAAAAELLGGQRAFGRWCRLVGDLRRGRLTARQAERELRHLLALLTLEHVGDPERDESAFFAFLDPSSEEVHEMCLLADALGLLLLDMADATARQEAAGRMPARVVQMGPGGRGRELAPPRWRSGPATRIREGAQVRPESARPSRAQRTSPPRPNAA